MLNFMQILSSRHDRKPAPGHFQTRRRILRESALQSKTDVGRIHRFGAIYLYARK